MKEQRMKVNFLLSAVVALACLALLLCRVLAPLAIPFRFDLPMMLGLSLAALTIEAYWSPCKKRPWFWTVLLAVITFALLPWCSGVTDGVPVWKLGLTGGAVFGVSTLLYSSILDRIASGPPARLAPIGNALMMFLAGQALCGLL